MRCPFLLLTALLLAAACARLALADGAGRPTFGVHWHDSRAAAGVDGRPVLWLSRDLLLDRRTAAAFRHPVVADAAGSLFHPTLSGGAKLLRITDAGGHDLVEPLRGAPDAAAVLRAMERSLRATGHDVPPYLDLAADEYAPAARAAARFAVSCYWKGEQTLGARPGVLATRTGTVGGAEAVEVEFDPTRVGRDALERAAGTMACFRGTLDHAPARPLDDSNQQQYHLWLHKAWHYVPLTHLQAVKVNAALVAGERPEQYLSPTQVLVQQRLRRAIERDRAVVDRLERLRVDRSPEGVAAYAGALSALLDTL